jgi:selenophosphate synthetase-related protein
MVVTGSAGVTVALTSTPAPPSLGDNTWTFTVQDSGAVAITGATITARQFMVDHAHGGAKVIVVTDLGGGIYRAAPVNFNMSGYWETTLHIVKAPIDDEVVIKLCVQ